MPAARARSTTDTDLVTALLAATPTLARAGRARGAAAAAGAFSLVFMDEDTLYAARDPQGIRPLVLGRLERGWVVASETPRWTSSAPAFVREVEPGELLAIDENGLRSHRFAGRARRAACSSTSTSPAPTPRSPAAACTRPASRSAAGWPASSPVEADLVIPVPESGTPAAIGYAEESGIPYGQGLVKNAYVGRTFIQPSARRSASSASGSSSTRCAR
jgi:amidophosphoribosyltransferase